MRFRKLRIAWSVFWGLACVLAIVQWVRSHRYFDRVDFPIGSHHAFDIVSFPGQLDLGVFNCDDWDDPWSRFTYPLGELPAQGIVLPKSGLGFYSWYTQEHIWIRLPYWFLSAASAMLVPAPWLKRRFSLRTLLIATTLVAMLLGLAVYAARK